jgi:signal transduction histidine kinase
MIYIVALLALIAIILAARLLFLRREIYRVLKDLQDLNTGASRKKLTVFTLHRPLETLCQYINLALEIRDKARISAENHKAELHVQISNIAHDLRTPLTAILGYLSMSKTAPEKTAYLEIMEDRAKVLKSLVEQFYELSIVEDSHTEFALESIDITATVTNTLLGNYTLFEEKGIKLESLLPEQPIMVVSNTQALERILQNLIQNALKFANEGVVVSLLDKSTHCTFTISNDAKNLTRADIEHLFKRFYTADKSRTAGNTGLGLYIVKRLLEKTKGNVSDVKFENGWFTLEISFAKTWVNDGEIK